MTARSRLFAGSQLQRLRQAHGLQQAQLAARLGISAPYLSQLEHNDRPLTAALAEKLAQLFPLDWQDIDSDDAGRLAAAMRDASGDLGLGDGAGDLARLAAQQPDFVRRFLALHRAYRHASQRLEMFDEALSTGNGETSRLPWEEVRDWFHLANNYVDLLDRAAEELAERLAGERTAPGRAQLEAYLAREHGLSVCEAAGAPLRHHDREAGAVRLDPAQPPAAIRFQLACQIAAQTFGADIAAIALSADLRTATARQLLRLGLINYTAGAIAMPYERFRLAARARRHDIDRLSLDFGTSFEQTCHRLSTLQRKGAAGLPVFFCRVDMAGNITKRHSATRLQFARFGGACPLWIVHEAVAIPDRVLVQLAETPDGARYVSMAKGLVKPSGSFERPPRRYAVALGCEVRHAREFIYADTLGDLESATPAPIGLSCRICPRADCDQRAFPPTGRAIRIDPARRGVVPYTLAPENEGRDIE